MDWCLPPHHCTPVSRVGRRVCNCLTRCYCILCDHSLLSDDNMVGSNLENLVATYHRYFTRQDSFRVGSAVVLLLRLRDLLPSPSQRLAALSLLHEIYRSDSASSNPFSLFFAEMLQSTTEGDGSVSQVERWFLAQILAPTLPREVSVNEWGL